MPPKVQRRPSVSAPPKDGAWVVAKPLAKPDMPPPPVPQAPMAILEPEMNALQTCLKNTVVKTGQIYGFYADAKRLGIDRYAPHPPRTLTASLGREVEKYDQLCDAMESRLNRAIAVLKRDVAREEARIQTEEAAAAAAAAEKARELALAEQAAAPPPFVPGSPKGTEPSEPSSATSGPSSSPQLGKPLGPLSARRQSTVALSSLQRPNFPHKLDLSAASLRSIPEDILRSGLSSPVTLAPKSSARALPPDLLISGMDPSGAPVDIDLTMDMDMQQAGGLELGMQPADEFDPSLGTSAEKPIELDLDMDMDLFHSTEGMHTDSGTPVGDIFSQLGPGGSEASRPMEGVQTTEHKDDPMSMSKEILDALNQSNAGANPDDSADIFASLGSHTEGDQAAMGPSDSQAATSDKPGEQAAPSPGSFLASFRPAAPSEMQAGGEPPFNFDPDLSGQLDPGFFSESVHNPDINNMTIEDIFDMGGSETERPADLPQKDAEQRGT